MHSLIDVIPERDEVDEMFQFDVESESDAEDNSLACIVAAVNESIATPAIRNGINGTINMLLPLMYIRWLELINPVFPEKTDFSYI